MVIPGPQSASGRIPVTVITGFLGSGKTTILRELLQTTKKRIAVLVNEVGDLGIDQHLLQEIDEEVLLLAGGCVCCSMRGDLHRAWEKVVALSPDHIILETTGLADPAPILHALATDPVMADQIELAGVITVVDALRAEELLERHLEFRLQLDFADRILITKTDLAAEKLLSVHERLLHEAAGIDCREAKLGEVDEDWLLGKRRFAATNEDGSHRVWLQHGNPNRTRFRALSDSAHEDFQSHSLSHLEPIHLPGLELWLKLVTQVDGPRLLRIKAVVRSAADGFYYVLQSANRSVAPTQRLEQPPRGLSGAEFVIIERGMPKPAMDSLLKSLELALAQKMERS